MTGSGLGMLRTFLVNQYDELKGRLTRRLGNADLANDALQETWLHLYDKGDKDASDVGTVQNPAAYLLRMASNLAIDQHRTRSREVYLGDIDALMDMPESAPGPERIVEARAECEELVRIIETMPERRRQILLAARLDGVPQYEIASRLGISLRLVERELQRAHEHCTASLKK